METIRKPPRQIPVIARVDVCVIGGGVTGIVAAIGAARRGQSVMLVERNGCLGGLVTAGLIGPVLGHTAYGSDKPTFGGIPKEICVRLAERGYAADFEDSLPGFGIPFNNEALKVVADRMVRQAEIRVMLHTLFADCIRRDGRITHAIVESKSGRQAIAADVFIDATGDADVAVRAGCEFTKGRPADGRTMAMGTIFHAGGFDTVDEETRQVMGEKTKQAVADGHLNLYNQSPGGNGSSFRDDIACCSMTRVAGDPTDIEDVTGAEMQTRADSWDVVELWRSVHGAEGVYLSETPAHIGIRESRQIVGEFRITGDDVAAGTKFDDGIARCGYPIDIHCPRGLVDDGRISGCSPNCPKRDCYMITEHADDFPDSMHPPEGDWFDIPYRTLLPEDIDGLIVGSRAIPADHFAMASLRVIGPCMAIGQAAGTAAAMAAEGDVKPAEVDTDQLRAYLKEAGAMV